MSVDGPGTDAYLKATASRRHVRHALHLSSDRSLRNIMVAPILGEQHFALVADMVEADGQSTRPMAARQRELAELETPDEPLDFGTTSHPCDIHPVLRARNYWLASCLLHGRLHWAAIDWQETPARCRLLRTEADVRDALAIVGMV